MINHKWQQSHGGSGGNISSTSYDYHDVVRAELWEMRGTKEGGFFLGCELPACMFRLQLVRCPLTLVLNIFYAMTEESVTWTEVCHIHSDADLFRGNVFDNHMRMVLDDTKHLKYYE